MGSESTLEAEILHLLALLEKLIQRLLKGRKRVVHRKVTLKWSP